MSWIKLARSSVRDRLADLLKKGEAREYTLQQLYLLVKPSSPEQLALALDELERSGVITKVYRVESPRSHGGIGDFKSIGAIPKTIHDWTVDEDVDVDPSLIRPIIKTPA